GQLDQDKLATAGTGRRRRISRQTSTRFHALVIGWAMTLMSSRGSLCTRRPEYIPFWTEEVVYPPGHPDAPPSAQDTPGTHATPAADPEATGAPDATPGGPNADQT